MTSREKVMMTFRHQADAPGVMWTGNPNEKTVPIFTKEWNIEPTKEAIFQYPQR